MSPTGAASKQFTGGKTIHAFLKLLVPKTSGKEKSFDELSEAKAQQLERDLSQLRLLIIDEKGMVGCFRLYQIDSRLRQARPAKKDVPFGGISVMIAGDLRQLPPVYDMALYDVPKKDSTLMESHGYNLYHLFDKDTYQLVDQMRQRGDHNESFRQSLADLAVNTFTESQYFDWKNRMCPKRMKNQDPERWSAFEESAIMLAGRKVDLHQHNEKKLLDLGSPICLSSAINHPPVAKTFDMDKAGGLLNDLHLAKGSRVLLTRNLWTESGLVNGADGYVRYIIYGEKTDLTADPPPMPDLLLVEFPGYTGPSYLENTEKIVPLYPLHHNWSTHGHENLSRMQFPLLHGYGITIHRAQGMYFNSGNKLL